MQSSRSSDTRAEEEAPAVWDGNDRRETDRRDAPTRPWASWLTPLRRESSGRRDADQSTYVDRYTRRDVALLLTIFLLNVGDAFFTMRWLARGGREANPIMDFFLDIGPGAFLAQKCIVVGFWLLILIVHKNFRFARIGLYASLVIYVVLIIIHFGIVLLGVEPPPPEDIAEMDTRSEIMQPASQGHSAYQWIPPADRMSRDEPAASVFVRRAGRPTSE